MFDFSSLKLVKSTKNSKDTFIGIRKSDSGAGFEFCLPKGFDNFPDDDFDNIRNLFFKMYRTFRKFERDNLNSKRFKKSESTTKKRYQDQTTLSGDGVSLETEDGTVCVIYSKINMIEQVLEAYDEFAINSIQYKVRRNQDIDYSQIHKYLDNAIYLEQDIIYIEAMDLPCPTLRYESTDIVNLYCYILYEIVQQLDGDVPDNIKPRIQEIHFLSQRFKDDYLTSNQSVFEKDTFIETINILQETFDNIDNNTYYKDSDYWVLYEAIETFLYGKINPNKSDGNYWGIEGFSLVWEDMCQTYFFKQHHNQICYADTDIILKGNTNKKRQDKDNNRIGNHEIKSDRWIYSIELETTKKPVKASSKRNSWHELLCIEFNKMTKTRVSYANGYKESPQKDTSKPIQRFLRPDLILKQQSDNSLSLTIIDYKYVDINFFRNASRKYNSDIIKQLTYELALQKDHEVSENNFFIPFYFETEPSPNPLGQIEPTINIKGIKIFKANFYLIQNTYLEDSL